jgi:hypothetical protein
VSSHSPPLNPTTIYLNAYNTSRLYAPVGGTRRCRLKGKPTMASASDKTLGTKLLASANKL